MLAEILLTNGRTISIKDDEVTFFMKQMNDADKFFELTDIYGKINIVNKEHVISMVEV